jgi:hypothetical protein
VTRRAYDPVYDNTPCCGYRPSLAITPKKQVVFCLGCGRNVAPYILFPNEPGLDLTTGLVGVVAADNTVQGVLW